jgi:hypothetical protein
MPPVEAWKLYVGVPFRVTMKLRDAQMFPLSGSPNVTL